MAKIIPIDVIKGISGKFGSKSNTYFATNSSSNKIRIANLSNPYKGPATERQIAQQEKFAARQSAITTWLNANKPNQYNGNKGSEEYQYAQKLKRQYGLSSVTQVLYKYMDDNNTIHLPEGSNNAGPSGGGSGWG